MYYANIGGLVPVKYRALMAGSIGVLDSPDNHTPIGEASWRGWDDQGREVWTLTIGVQPLEGRWVIIDREFRPVEGEKA